MHRSAAVLIALWLVLVSAPVHSAGDAKPDAAAIRTTISRQIEAFRHDDGAAAFAIASPEIQKMFRNPSAFMAMVAESYRAVHRAVRVDFAELVAVDGEIVQKVVLTGPDGVPVVALYGMERDASGAWRINGCVLVRPEEAPA
ncbi:MAG: DUF4864 domain-containing protein [Acetobacterales bacterium]